MPIDWFTVVAQGFNFLLLVWLLKRFLYRPILDAIDARQHRLDELMLQAKELNNQAQEQKNLYQQKIQQAQQEKTVLLEQAAKEAQQQRDKLLSDTYTEIANISDQRIAALNDELQQQQNSLAVEELKIVIQTSQKLFSDLLDLSVHEQVFNIFFQRLQNQLPQALNDLSKPLNQVMVKTAQALETKQKRQLEDFFKQQTKAQKHSAINIDYQVCPELACGIELLIGDWKIAWNSTDYLQTLQQQIEQNFNAHRATLLAKQNHKSRSSASAKGSE